MGFYTCGIPGQNVWPTLFIKMFCIINYWIKCYLSTCYISISTDFLFYFWNILKFIHLFRGQEHRGYGQNYPQNMLFSLKNEFQKQILKLF